MSRKKSNLTEEQRLEKRRAYFREYLNKRYANDIVFREKAQARCRAYSARARASNTDYFSKYPERYQEYLKAQREKRANLKRDNPELYKELLRKEREYVRAQNLAHPERSSANRERALAYYHRNKERLSEERKLQYRAKKIHAQREAVQPKPEEPVESAL